MPKNPAETPETLPEGATWEVELRRVGFVRRLLMARRWYGADWWFVAISGVAVLAFIIIAILPGLFAPYSPFALVGPPFLAPGAHVDLPVLIVPKKSSVKTLPDLAVPPDANQPLVSVVEGYPTAGALDTESLKIDEQIKKEPKGLRLRPVIDRYPSSRKPCKRSRAGRTRPRWSRSRNSRASRRASLPYGKRHRSREALFQPADSSWGPTTSVKIFGVACFGEPVSP